MGEVDYNNSDCCLLGVRPCFEGAVVFSWCGVCMPLHTSLNNSIYVKWTHSPNIVNITSGLALFCVCKWEKEVVEEVICEHMHVALLKHITVTSISIHVDMVISHLIPPTHPTHRANTDSLPLYRYEYTIPVIRTT